MSSAQPDEDTANVLVLVLELVDPEPAWSTTFSRHRLMALPVCRR